MFPNKDETQKFSSNICLLDIKEWFYIQIIAFVESFRQWEYSILSSQFKVYTNTF